MWFGSTWRQKILPSEPRRTHNFLELVYTIKELSDVDPLEIEFAKGNEFFCDKYYLKR